MAVVVVVKLTPVGVGGTDDTKGLAFDMRRLDAPAAFEPYAEM